LPGRGAWRIWEAALDETLDHGTSREHFTGRPARGSNWPAAVSDPLNSLIDSKR